MKSILCALSFHKNMPLTGEEKRKFKGYTRAIRFGILPLKCNRCEELDCRF